MSCIVHPPAIVRLCVLPTWRKVWFCRDNEFGNKSAGALFFRHVTNLVFYAASLVPLIIALLIETIGSLG
jgi:hypothetical protein